MEMIKWEDKYALGIERFDRQHQRLVSILNEVYVMFKSRFEEKDKLVTIVQSLTEYTMEHFSEEEQWMLENGYPGREEHIQEHKKFIGKISEFDEHISNETAYITMGIVLFLKEWLINHIMTADVKYSVFKRSD